MRSILLISVVMLAGCDHTLNGIGQDMQSAGASLSSRTAPEPPPPPLYPQPGYRDDDGYPSYQAQSVPQPSHDPTQPYYLHPRSQ
jgi:predicted small secreted protein